MKFLKRAFAANLLMVLLLSILPVSSSAADSLPLTTSQIKKKIDAYYTAIDPDNKKKAYWNKELHTNDLIKQANAGNYAAAISNHGCKDSNGNYTNRESHNKDGTGCQSNHFNGITSGNIQCSGFADYMIYVIFNSTSSTDFYKVSKKYNKYFTEDYEFYPGDLIRYNDPVTKWHSMVVYKVTNGNVYFIECNYAGGNPKLNCVIRKGTHYYSQKDLREKIINYGYIMIPKPKLRARVKPTVTTPAAYTGLIYTGSAQKLVKAGKVKGGTMYYALGYDDVTAPANADFATSIPTGTNAGTYYIWYKVIGDTNHANTKPVAIKVVIEPVTFILPDSTTTIEANAFAGDTSITTVDAHNCTTIGAGAFKDCTGLRQIQLPQNCQIDDTAFEGCNNVYLLAPANGSTQEYCQNSAHNCKFKAE